MQAVYLRIFLILFIFVLINPPLLPAATEQRVALVIGNSAYSSGPLNNPVNDATDMAVALKRAGFTVTLKKNADLQEMVEAIESFGNNLKRGGVGLFYYAGHGVQVSSVNYLLPVSAKINKESDVRFQAVDAGRVLAEMENANNGLNIVILDACRDNPFGKSFRSSSRGLAIVANAPSGTFISYSTGAGQVAGDGEGKNSPYTRALLENIAKPGLTINKVFMNVRSKVKNETGQVPWELSSLEGDFYFMPGSAKTVIDKPESVVFKTSPTNDLDDESKKLEAEQRRLEDEKASFVKKKALDEKRQQIEEERERLEAEKAAERQAAADRKKRALEEKQQKLADEKERIEEEKEFQRQAALERKQAKKTTTLAMGKRPTSETGNEISRDGRFIAYNNGTVLDTSTNLMWAAKDNGGDINLANAINYCKKYRGGGYTDWRMPTQNELAGLYDVGKNNRYGARVTTDLILITKWWIWASETRGSDAANFNIALGMPGWVPQSTDATGRRVIPVRSVK
jgi:uncharacterized caspase-like protein